MSALRKLCVSARPGGLLIEVVIGLALSVLFSVAIVTMGIGAFESVDQSRDQTVSVHYALEGIEALRTLSRQNFLLLIDGTYGVIEAVNGYELSGTGSDSFGQYKRQVTIESVFRNSNETLLLPPVDSGAVLSAGGWLDPQAKLVTSIVRWTTNGQNREVSMQSLLTKWTVYPLQAFSFGSGGAVHGTEWTANGLMLSKQLTFDPPVVLGTIVIPNSEKVVDMISDSSSEYVYAITEEGTLLSYLLEEAGSGTLIFDASVNLGATLYSMTLKGDYLYIASNSNTSEIFIVHKDTLAVTRNWDLSGTANAISVVLSTDDATLFVGRVKNGSEELYLIDPNPINATPVDVQAPVEVGDTVTIIAPYTSEWILFATDKTNKEFNIFRFSTAGITSCNMPGAQLITAIAVQGNLVMAARNNGPEPTMFFDSLNPADPSNCADYSIFDWDNSGNDSLQDAIFDDYEPLAYAVSDTSTLHFSYNEMTPSTVTTHTLETGSDCHSIASDGTLLYVACENGGTDRILVLGGGGSNRDLYVSSGTYIFPAQDAGTYARWKALTWTGTGETVRFQIRTGSGYSDLDSSAWIGPNADSALFYTATGGTTVLTNILEGERWMQVKAWLARTGILSPIVGSVYLLSE